MDNSEKLRHEKIKKTLKVAGLAVAACGLVCAVIGFVDFFAAFGGEGQPKLFFMLFIGLPLLAVGVMMLLFGFHREIARYGKNEVMPVINEAGKEAAPAVESVVAAAKKANEEGFVCPKCGHVNKAGANFCFKCGEKLAKVCPDCGKSNDTDASYCIKCGKKL